MGHRSQRPPFGKLDDLIPTSVTSPAKLLPADESLMVQLLPSDQPSCQLLRVEAVDASGSRGQLNNAKD